MNNKEIIEKIKSSFCNLTNFKVRENTLEVITAYSTINSKFISVFITFTNNKIVITDSGWVDQNYYETPLFEESEIVLNKIKSTYKETYKVKSTHDKDGIEFYYKTCETVNQIPSLVFDMANFIVGIVNSYCIQFKDEKEEKERENFRQEANDYLKSNYSDKIKFRQALDDFAGIKFNAIINKNSNLFLLTYVTGSTQIYFENDLRKSIVNFEIVMKSKYNKVVKERLTIINDTCDGFVPNKSISIFELLKEKTTKEPIKWTEKDRILEII